MTDDDIDHAIASALAQPGDAGLDGLDALRERVERARDAADPALGRLWDALVRIAQRAGDRVDAQLALAEGRVRWLQAARGPTHPDTLDAWSDLGETADLEGARDVAARAWEALVGAPVAGAPGPAHARLSRALRGLAGRRLAAGRSAEARALFERDLAINEALHPGGHPQLALSLGNLALVAERLGERERARALRERQRAVLVAAGGAPSQLGPVDAHLARLRAP